MTTNEGHKGKGWLGVAAGFLAAMAGPATAANIGVLPTKLVVVDKGAAGAKASFVAKDSAVTKGSGTNTSLISATLDLQYDNGTDPQASGQFVAAAGANWLVNKSTVAKYVNKTAPTGGGTKVSVVKPGKLLKLVGKNLGDTPLGILAQGGAATGTAHTAYCLDNDGVSNCFCSTLDTCAWKSIAGGTGAKLVCRGGAADNTCAAGSSALPALSHFWTYVTETGVGTVDPPTVTLQDQFIGPVSVDVSVALGLMVPVDKNGEGIPNPVDHLSIHVFESPYIPPPASGVRIQNQIGTQDLVLGDAFVLLVPTEKFPGPTPLVPQLDHYICYQAAGVDPVSFPVTLEDQFQTASATLDQVAWFCAPADKNGEGVLNADDHLTVYTHDAVGIAPGVVPIRNQFGSDTLDLDFAPVAVAVPSTKLQVYVCGDDVIDPVESCDGLAGGCILPETCNAQCQCESPVPPEWTCSPTYYGTSDGCDCGCGAVDPDCADATVGSCAFCDEPGSCAEYEGPGCPANIDPADNSTCTVPGSWTCNPAYWNANDGCDCGCGTFDPDCADTSVGSCDYCDDPGSCSTTACPGTIEPVDNSICTPPSCTTGTDACSGDPWVVCTADLTTAWVSHNNLGFGGVYHPLQICQSLGYTAVGLFGGTCGDICGFCDGTPSCTVPGLQSFDGNGAAGSDGCGSILSATVMWECTR